MINPVDTSNQLQELLALSRPQKPAETLSVEEMRLREACNEFEAVLTSTMLKEGMKTAREIGGGDDDEDRDAGSENFKELAHEQIAAFIGRQGMLGLGDMLFQATRHKLNDTGDRK